MEHKQNRVNGMTKEEIIDSLEATQLMTEGFEMLLELVKCKENGEEVQQRELRKAQLKLQESFMIMKDIESKQKKYKAQTNTHKPQNRKRWN